jgi:hypothetical protein
VIGLSTLTTPFNKAGNIMCGFKAGNEKKRWGLQRHSAATQPIFTLSQSYCVRPLAKFNSAAANFWDRRIALIC